MNRKKINYIISKPNLKYNVGDFFTKNNVLFITGLSGSGKTTLSFEISNKYKAEIFNLDCLSNFYSTKFNNTLIKKITGNFLKLNVDIDKILKNEKYMDLKLNHFDEYKEYNKKYFNYVCDYCIDHRNTNFVIEGTQLFMTLDPTFFYDKSLIIVRKSAMKSLIRRLKRELKDDEKKHPLTVGKRHIKKLLNDSKRLHYRDLKKLNLFINSIQKSNGSV